MARCVIRRRLGLQVQICDENYTNTSTKYSAGARRTSGSTHQANVGLLRYKSPQFPFPYGTVQADTRHTGMRQGPTKNGRQPAGSRAAALPGKDQAGLPLARRRESTTARTRSDGGNECLVRRPRVRCKLSHVVSPRRQSGSTGQRLLALCSCSTAAACGGRSTCLRYHRLQSHRRLCRQRRLFSDFVVASASLVRHRCRHRNTRACDANRRYLLARAGEPCERACPLLWPWSCLLVCAAAQYSSV